MLRQNAGHVLSQVSQIDSLVEECRYSFGLSEEFATRPALLTRAYEWASNRPTRRRSTRAGGFARADRSYVGCKFSRIFAILRLHPVSMALLKGEACPLIRT